MSASLPADDDQTIARLVRDAVPDVIAVYRFGSSVTGLVHPDSDIDDVDPEARRQFEDRVYGAHARLNEERRGAAGEPGRLRSARACERAAAVTREKRPCAGDPSTVHMQARATARSRVQKHQRPLQGRVVTGERRDPTVEGGQDGQSEEVRIGRLLVAEQPTRSPSAHPPADQKRRGRSPLERAGPPAAPAERGLTRPCRARHRIVRPVEPPRPARHHQA
jgi:hypothetical protein